MFSEVGHTLWFLVSSEFVNTEVSSIFWWVFSFQQLVLQDWEYDTYKKRNMFLSTCKLKLSTNMICVILEWSDLTFGFS